jgi:hypothetical protein
MYSAKTLLLAAVLVGALSGAPASAGYIKCAQNPNVDECAGLVGGVVPGCVALERLTGLTCAVAASRAGLSYSTVSDEEMLLGVVADADVSYEQEVWDATDVVPDNCDIRFPETCLPPTGPTDQSENAGVTPGPTPWGSTFGLRISDQEGRSCASEAYDSSLLGKSYRYVPDHHVQGSLKFVVWSQWHNAHRTDTSDRLKYVGQSMSSQIASAIDADPLGTIPLGSGTNLQIGLSGPYGFGFSASWQAGGDRVVGEIVNNYRQTYASWSGSSTTPQAIRGAQIWQLPKHQQGDFSGHCAALTY